MPAIFVFKRKRGIELRFEVTNREIKCDYDSFKHLIGDNADYKATFVFDEEWNGHIKTARFIHSGQCVEKILENDMCDIPLELLKSGCLKVGVYSDVMTTTPCEVHIRASIKQENGTTPDPTPDVYAQIINMLENFKVPDEQIEKAVEKYMKEHPIVPPVAVTLESITATKEKVSYNVGDVFDYSDIIVIAHYSNGTTKDVTSSATINTDNVNMDTANIFSIAISYTENNVTKTTSIEITVSQVEPMPIVPQTGTWQLKTTTGKKYIILGTDDDNYGNTKFFRLLRTYNFPYTMNVTAEATSDHRNMGSDADDTIFTDADAPALFNENIDVVTLGKYLHESGLGEVAQHGDSAYCLWSSDRLTGDFLTSLHTTYTEAGGTKTEEELRTAIMEQLADTDCANDAPYVENSRSVLEESLGFPIYTVGSWGSSSNPVVDGIELNISGIRHASDYNWRGHNYTSASTSLSFYENKSIYDLCRVGDNPSNIDNYINYISNIQPDKVCEFYWHMPFNDQPDISKWRALFDYIKGLVDSGEAEIVTRKQYAELGEYVDNPITSIKIERENISVGSTDSDNDYVITVTHTDGSTSLANSDAIIDRSAVNTEEEGSYTVYVYYRGFRSECNVAVTSSYTVPEGLKDTEYWFVYRNNTNGNWYCGNITTVFISAQMDWRKKLEFKGNGGNINGWKSTDNGLTWEQVTTNAIVYTYIGTDGSDTTKYNFDTVGGESIDFIETSGNFEITY